MIVVVVVLVVVVVVVVIGYRCRVAKTVQRGAVWYQNRAARGVQFVFDVQKENRHKKQ